jgi:hypothetical protein
MIKGGPRFRSFPASAGSNAAGRKVAFILLTALIPFLLMAGLIAGIEWFFRHRVPPPTAPLRGTEQITQSVKAILSAGKNDPPPSTHIPVHVPAPVYPEGKATEWSNPSIQQFLNIGVEIEPGSLKWDPLVGVLPTASRSARARTISPDEKLIYDVHYGSDEWNRRITPGQEKGKRSQALLFLGCSFAYGLGLNDKDTLPSAVARGVRNYRSYNYAFPSWGPGNVLRRLTMPSLEQEVPEKGGVAIYVFIDHHMARLLGNLSLERFTPNWRSILPYYYLDEAGKLQSDGMLQEGRPFESRLFSLLAGSSTLKYFRVDFPIRYSERDFKLLTMALQEMRKTLDQRLKIRRFYVLLYPGSQLAKPLIHYLDRAGIASIDYSGIDLSRHVRQHTISREELHPSAESQRFVARLLEHDLGLQ